MSDSGAGLVVLIPRVQMTSCLTKNCSEIDKLPECSDVRLCARKFSFQNCFEGCALMTSKVLQSAFVHQIGTLW